MKTQSILGLLIYIVLVFSLSFAQPADAASAEEEVLQIITNMEKALNTYDIELSSSLWWHSPKVSQYTCALGYPFIYQGWEQLEESGVSPFSLPKGSFTCSFHNPQVNLFGDNFAIITVYEILTINPPAVEEQVIEQHRHTLVAQKIDGKWLLIHQHVSSLPV